MSLSPELAAAVAAWREQDPDAATVVALDALTSRAEAGDADAAADIADAFSGPLEFGTAGLRGALGPGPARMNRVVVSQAAAGLAQYLLAQGHAGGSVIIGYDARYNSDVFARDTAEIMAGAGLMPLLVERPTPTPVIAFGIGHFGAVAGVVVTASHNPPQDNGYKVYLGDGSQIVPPADSEIAAQIAAVAERPLADIARGEAITIIGDELDDAYVARAAALVAPEAPRDLTWVYTAMHGVGARIVDRVVSTAGFRAGLAVQEQVDPDPAFPTVAFPNPEEPGAIDLALALAEQRDADLVVANDPDADRCAVAARLGSGTSRGVEGGSSALAGDRGWRMLTGDELGALLADDTIRRGIPGQYACSVVSSTLLQAMAAANEREFTATLTGFKWIGRVPDLAFGYEEAIGYCCDSGAVPDKDGITALVRVLALAAELKAHGSTIADRLDEIWHRYGLYTTSQLSVRVQDLSMIADAMKQIRAEPPAHLLGQDVVVYDLRAGSELLPPTDAVEFSGETLHVVVRPSGTEPKLKCYLEVRQSVADSADLEAARAAAAVQIDQLRAEMAAALGLS